MPSTPVTFFQTDPDDVFNLDIDRFPHPFTGVGEDHYDSYDEDDQSECDSARTLVELRMCELSATIREKPDWQIKFRDETIRNKWIEEIREQQKGLHQSLQLTNNMVRETLSRFSLAELVSLTESYSQINYVMTELEAYAALRDGNTGIEVRPQGMTCFFVAKLIGNLAGPV